MKLRFLAIVVTIALSACGGGSSSPISPGQSGGGSNPGPAATATPRGSTNPNSWLNKAAVTITFSPKKGASQSTGPKYVSPSSTVFNTVVNSVNGGAPPSWVPTTVPVALANGTNCTGTTTWTCTLVVPAPPGTVNYTFTTTDGTNALSTFTGDETITQGSENNLNVVLEGIIAAVGLNAPSVTANTALTGAAQDVTLDARDADGNLIVDGANPANYASPVTLTDNDPSGLTTLSINGSVGASSVVVDSPLEAGEITLNYDGQAINNTSLTASGTGFSTVSDPITSTVQDITFPSGTLDDTTANGGLSTDPNWGAQTVFFYGSTGGIQGVTASELGFTNAPYSQAFNVTLDASCSGIATLTGGTTDTTSFTVDSSGSPGICFGNVTESGTGYPLTNHPGDVVGSETHDGKFWISVTTASIGVNAKHRH